MSDKDSNIRALIEEKIQGKVIRHDIVIGLWNAQLKANLEETVEEEDSRNLGFPAATAKKVRDLGYLAAAMEDEALHLAFLVAVAEKKEIRELVFPAAAAIEGEPKGHGFPAATLEKEGVGGFGSPVAAL
ncbi:hypothetical protein IEQ34_006844 [Dendrobium chrysotoxum]|uniref:Uncharacterized protein n=1 Tax=Dendrobium chrysotoxum TaxID=161865 RepID=A0AAV7H9B0_DENCH|nr:hypothetical protein IEQ34_006844 [Dendrobium chrysotoxum]